MTHEFFQEQISVFVDHELAREAEVELFSHLSTCKDCRDYFTAVLKLRSSLMKDAMNDSQRIKELKETSVHPSIYSSSASRPALHTFRRRGISIVKRKLTLPLAAVIAAFVLTVAGSVGVSSRFFRTEKVVERDISHTVFVMQLPEVEVKGYYLTSSPKKESTKND